GGEDGVLVAGESIGGGEQRLVLPGARGGGQNAGGGAGLDPHFGHHGRDIVIARDGGHSLLSFQPFKSTRLSRWTSSVRVLGPNISLMISLFLPLTRSAVSRSMPERPRAISRPAESRMAIVSPGWKSPRSLTTPMGKSERPAPSARTAPSS